MRLLLLTLCLALSLMSTAVAAPTDAPSEDLDWLLGEWHGRIRGLDFNLKVTAEDGIQRGVLQMTPDVEGLSQSFPTERIDTFRIVENGPNVTMHYNMSTAWTGRIGPRWAYDHQSILGEARYGHEVVSFSNLRRDFENLRTVRFSRDFNALEMEVTYAVEDHETVEHIWLYAADHIEVLTI